MKGQSSKFKHGRVLNIAVAVFAALILSILPISMMVSASDDTPVLTLTANLVSPTGSVNPHGNASYEVYQNGQRELEIEAEDVNAANGVVLDFFVNGASVGQASLLNQKAKLKLKTELGQTVPTINNGSTVAVKLGTATILTGVFGGGNGTPTPTVSPTGSPSPSPSVSPTGSPSPSPSVSPTASPSPTVSPTPHENEGNELNAVLTGATINGVLPNGFAEYELEDTNRAELEVRVRQVNLPIGTSLSVSINTTTVGSLVLQNGGEGRLRLQNYYQQTVPVITPGTTITIKNGATTILAGVFMGGGATPSPSPTASPTPNQGRFFEAHLSGSQVVPPVTTSATGEVKVFLNQTETQATITGEFHNLSSAETGAKIEVTLAGTTSVVFTFPVIGGTNGNFPSATIAVTSAQVAQLRTGLWSAVIASVNNPSGEIRGQLTTHNDHNDFDGDGRNDISVFRPSSGTWYTQNSLGIGATVLGGANDKLVSGDYDGDGRTDAAVFQNVNGAGVWTIKRSSDGGTTTTQFGFATDTPVRGDFDGDGRSDLAVYRGGTWYIQKSDNSGFVGVTFGDAADKPVAADFDGDGKDDIAVFRPSNGVWYSIKSSNGAITAAAFGQAGDIPIAGDFDGDGRADLSVFRPSDGVWYIQRSSNGTFDFRRFGLSDDIPVAGDYDGDNKTDIAVFRPSTGIWYIWRSVDGTFDYRLFGQAGDVPTPVR